MSDPTIKLLIVDDEPATRTLLAHIFSSRGHQVRTAEDGFAALRHIRDAAPDVLLSDLNMPGMTGFELLSVVRRLYPGIQVIATSGAYSGNAVPHGIAADAFYEKAAGLSLLFDLMTETITRSEKAFSSARTQTPIWLDLGGEIPSATLCDYALITCPFCLRAFRMLLSDANTIFREAACIHCASQIEYAIAQSGDDRSLKAMPVPEALARPIRHTTTAAVAA